VCPTIGFDAFGTRCVTGRCTLTCELGMADCDANPNNGCEAFLLFDSANCGACGMKCDKGEICQKSMCSCPGGFKSCAPAAGGAAVCTNVRVDKQNCGDCGTVCNGKCINGACK